MREPLEDRYEGFRRKEYEPLGYLSKLFPSLIPLSVATTLRRKTLVTADGLTKEMCVSVYLYAKEVKRLYIRRQGLCSLAYTIWRSSNLALYCKQALFRLPNLPLHCWTEDSLSRVGSTLGVPLFADACTSQQLRISFARLLIEMDITQPLPTEIQVEDASGNNYTQPVVYEWKPPFCASGNKVGHNCSQAQKSKPSKAKTVLKFLLLSLVFPLLLLVLPLLLQCLLCLLWPLQLNLSLKCPLMMMGDGKW